jgi:hypothetical protein
VRLECVVGSLVSRQIRARRWVLHGECECDCCEKLGAFYFLGLRLKPSYGICRFGSLHCNT